MGMKSNQSRKVHAPCTKDHRKRYDMNFIVRPSKASQMDPISLIFNDCEAQNVHHEHYEAIIIAAQVANHMVFQMTTDNGSLVDILYISDYDAMVLKREPSSQSRNQFQGLLKILFS